MGTGRDTITNARRRHFGPRTYLRACTLTAVWGVLGCDVAGTDRDAVAPGLVPVADDASDDAAESDALSKEQVATLMADGQAAWSEDICEVSTNADGVDWYHDGECDWFCPSPDPACDVPALGPAPHGARALYPIVLVHGFMSDDEQFASVAAALRADGHAVVSASVPPIAPVSVRAEHLSTWVDHALTTYGVAKVNLVAHSMGGLDARYLVSSMGYDDRVASVTTVATPHRGSPIADIVVGLSASPSSTVSAIHDLIVSRIEASFVEYDEEDFEAAIWDLTEVAAPSFNGANPNRPGVHYQSWAGISSKIAKWPSQTEQQCGDVLAHEASWFGFGADLMAVSIAPLSAFLGKWSDGVVPLASTKWGEFRGCVPADHLEQTYTGGPKWITGYDADRFFRNIAFDLAKRGL